MTIKRISDIRLFRGNVPNVDGQPQPALIDDKTLTMYPQRVAMKLRELNFSLGDFDHLYLNLTPCLTEGTVQLSARTVYRETAWYRYVDAGITPDWQFSDMQQVSSLLEKALLLFAAEDARPLINTAFAEAQKGAHMLMQYKEKTANDYSAVIFLRLLDSGMYHPQLQVHWRNQLLLQADLSPCWELHQFGEISITKKAITIKPRRNIFASGLTSLVFHLDELHHIHFTTS